MRGRGLVLAVLFLALAGAVASGQADPWYTRTTKLPVLNLQAPSGEWVIDYPRKDWVVAPSGGSTLALLVQKNAEASVAFERAVPCVEIRAGGLTDTFLEAEVELIKQEHPDARSFEQRLVKADGRRVFVVQFERPGLKGSVDRIRQYSFAAGRHLYRLLCTAPVPAFARYDSTFAHIAASLNVKE